MVKKLTKEEQEKRRKELKEFYFEKGITSCELRLPPTPRYPERCWKDNALSFAHKEKRWKYIRRPEELWTFKETVLACIPCHQRIENDRLLTLVVFKKLRNN